MYTAHNYEHLIGMAGLSEEALRTHFGLYEGYVTNVNALHEKITAQSGDVGDAAQSLEVAELKRRFGWEFNGMRLHEYYFGVMTKEKSNMADAPTLIAQIEKDFGSMEKWQQDFAKTAAQRGIGWTILVHDTHGGGANRLYNIWVNEHDLGHLAGTTIIIPIDVFEHAFMIDYGMKRSGYIDAFIAAIDWTQAQQHFTTQ